MAASLRGRDEAVIMAADSGPFAPRFALRQEISARSVGKRIGHFFGALQIDGLSDKDEFKKNKSTNGFASFAKPNPLPAPAAR